MRPRTGGRAALDLVTASSGRIVYRATLHAPDAEWRGEATIDGAGAVAFAPWTPETPAPPAWLTEYARTFLRAEWRSRQGADPAPWPGRITRWRAG